MIDWLDKYTIMEDLEVEDRTTGTTMLHLLGMDHTKLTYRFSGRDMRLTDVAGTLIPQIVG